MSDTATTAEDGHGPVDLGALDAAPHAQVYDEPETVLLELSAGESVPEHSHPGTEIVCHVIDGQVGMAIDDETHEVAAGECLQFSGDRRISPTAREDVRALLVFVEGSDG